MKKKSVRRLSLSRQTLRALGATDNDIVWSGYNYTCGDLGCAACPGTGGLFTCEMFCSVRDTCQFCTITCP